MVIQPGDNIKSDHPDMILSFFRWTAFGMDAFNTFFGHRDGIC
jgi:hypothetical protein